MIVISSCKKQIMSDNDFKYLSQEFAGDLLKLVKKSSVSI